ncbi:MAG: redox-sensitive transcriptional activator SoxR [Rhodobacteraceae bacterium]|nr:redox-sensitive transcriptional activator SoxR [Paracoccaceae bacterium]
MERTISIGQLAERTGLAVSAIRYYETQNLIHPERNAGGQRRYLRSDIRRLSFIRIAQQFGFSISDIRIEIKRLPAARTPTKRDWEKIARHFGRVLDQRIAALQQLRDRLDGCIGCGCLSLNACALYNPDDRAERLGAGPRYVMGDQPEA